MSILWGQAILCIVIGYVFGEINPSYLLAKIKGFDIRTLGSGNAGASNAVITMGKFTGLVCAVFDILKAFFAVKICMKLFPLLNIAGIIAGGGCILGHIFPATMNFHGGKGLATLGGVIFGHNYKLFIGLLVVEILLVLIIDYICIVAPSGSILFTLFLFINDGFAFAVAFIPVVIAILVAHVENYRRIQYGVEARFSYLWRKEEETERLQKNWDLLTDEQRDSFKSKAYI